MKLRHLHSWEVSTKEAAALQRILAPQVVLENRLPNGIDKVAGVDVSYQRHGDRFFAAVVVLRLSDWQVLEEATSVRRTPFPYVPGLLSFRELPAVLDAFADLRTVPDVVLVDGQGIAHPRRFGLASHLGLWLDLPTVGCAKSRLCGEFAAPGPAKGERSELRLGGEPVGMVLTSRTNVKPLFVSPGHKIDVDSAADLTLRCTTRYRMPEPTRLAHQLANRCRKLAEGGK